MNAKPDIPISPTSDLHTTMEVIVVMAIIVAVESLQYHYDAGVFYTASNGGYTARYKVVAPTAGTIVESLPEGGEEVTIGDQKYVKFGETYYQPNEQYGKSVYEVAIIEKD